LHVVTLCCRC